MGFAIDNCEPWTVPVVAQAPGAAPLGFPADSIQTLLADLAALARHSVTTTAMSPAQEFVVHWHPTELQQKALKLPDINHTTCAQYSPGLAKMLSRITRLPIEMGRRNLPRRSR